MNAFDCKRCGHCCDGAGGIILSDKDVARLAAWLQLSAEEFLARHAEEKSGKRRLKSREDNYCVFFDQGCSVHEAKPDVCRAWPFFKGNLEDAVSWKLAQDYCPGINAEASFAEFVEEGRRCLREDQLASENGAANALSVRLDP